MEGYAQSARLPILLFPLTPSAIGNPDTTTTS